jgi:predicted phage tail protein
MKVVKVYGALRKFLGGRCRFEFDVLTPAEAIKALCVNFPGLENWLMDRENEGMNFRVSLGREKITNNDGLPLILPWSDREVFSITPVIVGAGRGVGQILAGIGFIALAVVLGPAAGALLPGLALSGGGLGIVGATVATAIAGIGVSLALGGVAQLISPQPTMGGLIADTAAGSSGVVGSGGGQLSRKESVRLESFSFSGVVNTTKQGLPVPICYGRCVTGSAVISVGLDVV